MMPMQTRAAYFVLILLVSMLGVIYGSIQRITLGTVLPLALAFGVEAALYVLTASAGVREALQKRFTRPVLACLMVASAVAPYCLYAIADGVFRWASLGAIALLAALLSFWYVALRRGPVVDLIYVAVVAAGILGNPFAALYGTPVPKLTLWILGQLMWTRVAMFAVLALAGMEVKGFGFIPNRAEWRAGLINFVLFVPVGVALGWATGFAHFRLRPWEWWQALAIAVATFIGMLWVVALREEFFFRGMLQEWLSEWMGSRWAGIAAASVLFGTLHLPFRQFPNWRFALLATAAGVFYGRAYITARSIRAAMVTHALVNTAWRILF
jgi:uncharacterized protein